MKRIFTVFSIAVIFNACLSETGVNGSKPSTFIRYYYGGYNDSGVALEETSDKGFILLSTVTINGSEALAARYKIKLTKTDEFGNIVWQKRYPEFSTPQDTVSYRASGLQILQNGGYVITGEHIQKHNSQMFVMTLDNSGTVQKPISIANPDNPRASLFGKAVSVSTTGNYYVLGFSGSSEMLLTELKKDDLTPAWGAFATTAWFKKYDAGQTSLNNRIFTDDAGKIFWSGTVTKTNTTGIRVVKTSPNAQNTDFDLTLVNPGFSEDVSDFCRFGFGYALIGSTNQKTGQAAPGDRDILFKRLGEDGAVLSTQSFTANKDDPAKDTQNDAGNSISSTQDGGLILLASVNSVAIDGQGDNDYLLIKVDAFGKEAWRSNFGSRFKDTGVSVRQSSDGNYVVLGTTSQGGRDILSLIKTNAVGKVE